MLAPVWVVLATLSLVVGLATFSGADPAVVLAAASFRGEAEMEQLSVLVARVVLLPFHLIFIALVVGATLWVFRRRGRIAGWVLGEPLTDRLFARDQMSAEVSLVLPPGRRHTMHQILSSIVALSAILLAVLLSMGQFIARTDLAIVVAALTSSLAWGARLPIGDLLDLILVAAMQPVKKTVDLLNAHGLSPIPIQVINGLELARGIDQPGHHHVAEQTITFT